MEKLILVLSILLVLLVTLLFGIYINNTYKQMKRIKNEYFSEKKESRKNLLMENYNRARTNIIEGLFIGIFVIGILIALGFAVSPNLF